MGLSFKVAPGVRIRASSRGLSAGVGPRAARVHVGTRGVGVSSGAGPVSGYAHLGGATRRSSSGGGRATYGPTKAAIAARERELRQAEREADIEKVVWLEKGLVSVHEESFPDARRVELPAPEAVDPEPIREQLEQDAGVPQIVEKLGGGDEAPPVAPAAESVDRYELMRSYRRKARQGISIFKIAERIRAARRADEEADVAAQAEEDRRVKARGEEQERLDGLWTELQQAKVRVEDQLPGEVEAEKQRREAERTAEQERLDGDWQKLRANDPMTTIAALEEAFADNESPAAPLNCEGDRTTVVMQCSQPETMVPERKPAWTPGGKRTLKKRTKTEINSLYLEAIGSGVLATVKEAFAVAPGTNVVQMLVIRREMDKKHADELAAIYVGEFDRDRYAHVAGSPSPGAALSSAPEASLNLKGKTQKIAPIDLSGSPDLNEVLAQVADGLGT